PAEVLQRLRALGEGFGGNHEDAVSVAEGGFEVLAQGSSVGAEEGAGQVPGAEEEAELVTVAERGDEMGGCRADPAQGDLVEKEPAQAARGGGLGHSPPVGERGRKEPLRPPRPAEELAHQFVALFELPVHLDPWN